MLSKEVVIIYAPFALWVVANYLVSTINDGEGSFKDIYIATIYALFPFILFKPFLIGFSNALTFNESFLIEFSNIILLGWTALMIFIMVREIHDLTFKETFKNLLITIFSMLILMLVLFIVYVLLDQVFDFVYSVIQELIIRGTM